MFLYFVQETAEGDRGTGRNVSFGFGQRMPVPHASVIGAENVFTILDPSVRCLAGSLVEECLDKGVADQQSTYLDPGGASIGDERRGDGGRGLSDVEDLRSEFGGVQISESCRASSLALSVIAASHSQ